MKAAALKLVSAPGAMTQALDELRRRIIRGDLAPGEQIRQEEMAEQLHVSRVPLREALNVLADQGLLKHRRNQGYFVVKRGPDELRQITRMLALLETELVTSLEWPNEDKLAALVALNEDMRRTVDDDAGWSDFVRKNRELHFGIFDLSPQRLVFAEVQRLWTLGDPFITTKLSERDARVRTVGEHDALLEALRLQDRELLARAHDHHRRSTAKGFV